VDVNNCGGFTGTWEGHNSREQMETEFGTEEEHLVTGGKTRRVLGVVVDHGTSLAVTGSPICTLFPG